MSNLDPHDQIYKNLKKMGATGWGAESFERRMRGWEKTLEWALPYFPKSPARVLDIGCGAGDSAIPLAKMGYDLVGVDISQTAIDWASEKFEKLNLSGSFFVQDLAQDLINNLGHYDLIVDSATVHCILPPLRVKAFGNIRSLLNDKGIFLLSSMVGDPKELDKIESFDPICRIQKVKGLPQRYTPHVEQLKNEIQDSGFRIQYENIQINSWWNHYNAILIKA